jgi:hypothetical protein
VPENAGGGRTASQRGRWAGLRVGCTKNATFAGHEERSIKNLFFKRSNGIGQAASIDLLAVAKIRSQP